MMSNAISQPAYDDAPDGAPIETAKEPRKGSFRNLIMRAAGWSVLGYMFAQMLRIASSLILTRLLVPDMFGIMAVATMVQVSVAMLSDLGLRPAAIQSRLGDRQSYLDTAWTVQIIHGLTIWSVCIVVALGIGYAAAHGWFPAGSVYMVPELPEIIVATCFSTVIMGLQSTKLITAYRSLDLARVTIIEITAQVISLAIAVLLAWMTGSIWSFVISTLMASATTTVLSHAWLPGERNRLHLDKEAVHDLIRFGRWIMLSSILTIVAANGDRILLAGWTSPTMLGLYILAFNLIAMMEGAGGRLFSGVAMPALSEVARQRPQDLRRVLQKFRLPFDLVFIFSAGAIYSGGEFIIGFLYDDRYKDAAMIIEILSFSILIMRFSALSSVYLAIGEPRYQTILNFIRAVSIFVCLPLAYFLFGFQGAIWAVALHTLPTVPVIFYFNHRHKLNSPVYEVLVLFVWPVGYAAGWVATAASRYFGLI